METLEKMLSPSVSEYTIVLFSYGDTSVELVFREDKNLKNFVQKWEGSFQVFNNDVKGDTNQVREL